MDEVRLDLPQGLPSQEEYHIDLDAPTAGIDDLDFGLDTRFDTRPDDTRDTEAGEDDISYEEAQDEYNSNHANLTASVPTPPGSYDDADDGLDEIGYEDDEIHIDTAEKTAVDGAGGDIGTNNVGLSPGEGTADPASQESVPTDYHDQNTGGLSEIERQVPTFEQIDVEEFDDLTGADSGTGESHLDNTELAKGRGEGGLELTEDDDADDENADDENADQENFGDFENVDVGNMDVGNADGNKSTPELPDVAVEYNHVRYSLFGGPQDHDEDYFLKDVGVLDKPLPQLFSALRDIIVDDISPTDELLIRIDKLDCLEFREHSASPFLRRTFREVLDLYYRLLANDGSGEDRLLIHLIVVPSSEDVFTRLLAASEEGHGLAEIAGSSEEVSPAVNDDYSSKNGGDVEQEEEAAVPEYIEHYGIDEGASEPEDGADFNESALLNAEPRDQRSMVEDFAAEDAVDLGEESAAHFDTFDPEVGEAYSSGDYSQHGRKEVGANAPDTRGNDLPDDSTSFDVVPHEPLTDPFELGNEDGAAATERDKDDIDYSLGGGDTYNSLSNGKFPSRSSPTPKCKYTIAFGAVQSPNRRRPRTWCRDILDWCSSIGDDDTCLTTMRKAGEGLIDYSDDEKTQLPRETVLKARAEEEDLIDYSDDEPSGLGGPAAASQSSNDDLIDYSDDDETLALIQPAACAVALHQVPGQTSPKADQAGVDGCAKPQLADGTSDPAMPAAQPTVPQNLMPHRHVGKESNAVGNLQVYMVRRAGKSSHAPSHSGSSTGSFYPLPKFYDAVSRDSFPFLSCTPLSESSFAISQNSEADILLHEDTLEFALNPDGEQEVTHETDVPEGEGDDVYNPKIGNPGDENILQDGTSTTPQIGNSLSKVNQTETTYASAAQENPSAHTSATSTVNGEEIDYDENDGDFVGPEAEDPAASDANLGTAVDEIDWENADDEGDSIEATAANMTPRSASGKRLRQVEGLESLTDEGDNKRRRT